MAQATFCNNFSTYILLAVPLKKRMASDEDHRPCLPLKPQEKNINLYIDISLKGYYTFCPKTKNIPLKGVENLALVKDRERLVE